MFFLKSIPLAFRFSVFSKYSSFSTSKLSDVKPSNRSLAEIKEDRRMRRQIDMTRFLLKKCGFSESQVIAIGKRDEDLFKAKFLRRAKQAVQLFRDSDFAENQVRKIIFIQPSSLQRKVSTQLKPKIEFMKALGFTGSNLGHIISREPKLLGYSLEQNLRPKISLLLDVFGSKLLLCKTLMRYPRLLLCKIDELRLKIDVLRRSGLQDEVLLYQIMLRPHLILRSEEALKLEIEYVTKLGILEGSIAFAKALAVVDSSGLETVENKLKRMGKLGLLENEILQIVRRLPHMLTYGIDKIKKNMDFLKNVAGFQPNVVVLYPRLLNYSIENRIQPRHKVIEFLRKTEPARLPECLAEVYELSEQNFADKFLMNSPEATKLFEKCKGKYADIAIS